MTKTPLAQTLNQLFDYLADDRWDLGELIVDACDGAWIMDPTTDGLLRQLFNAMPEPDNFSTQELAEEIRRVGTPYAVGVANDIDSAI